MSDDDLKRLTDMILRELANSKEGVISEALLGFNKRANEYRRNNRFAEAEDLCHRSLKFAQDTSLAKFNDITRDASYAEGVVLMHLGVTFLSQRKLDKAVDCFERAAVKFHDISKRKGAGIAWMALGETHALRCDWECTVASYQKCLSVLGANHPDQDIRELRTRIEIKLDDALDTLSADCTPDGVTPGPAMVDPIPVAGIIAAGSAMVLRPDPSREFVGIDPHYAGNVDFALRVQGTSMINAGIKDKDLVLIEKQDYASDGDIAVVTVTGSYDDPVATLKRFYKKENHWRLEPENDTQETIVVVRKPSDEDTVRRLYQDQKKIVEMICPGIVTIEGKVVGVLRSYR